MSEAATRQGDFVAPPGLPGTFNGVTRTAPGGAGASNVDLHADADSIPAGYYITVSMVSGGPVHMFFAPDTSVAASATNGLTLSAGQVANFKLSALTKSTAGVDTYPHRYIMYYADAAAVFEWYISTPQAVI